MVNMHKKLIKSVLTPFIICLLYREETNMEELMKQAPQIHRKQESNHHELDSQDYKLNTALAALGSQVKVRHQSRS
jgi:hypothetical protein